jgi:hypothetical protein
MRRAVIVLLVTWATAFALLAILVDYNTYVIFPNGSVLVKERVTVLQRLLYSALFAAIYGLVNTVCVFWLFKSRQTNAGQAQPDANAPVSRQTV